MRCLVNYIRQVFCAHEWESEERLAEKTVLILSFTTEPKVHTHCKKCHWSRNYWKWSSWFSNTRFAR